MEFTTNLSWNTVSINFMENITISTFSNFVTKNLKTNSKLKHELEKISKTYSHLNLKHVTNLEQATCLLKHLHKRCQTIKPKASRKKN